MIPSVVLFSPFLAVFDMGVKMTSPAGLFILMP